MSTPSPPPPTPGAAASSAVCPSRLPELSVLRSLEPGWCPCALHLPTSQPEPRGPPRRRPPPGLAGQLPDRPSPRRAVGDNHFGSNLGPPPLCGKIWGNRSPHRPQEETKGRGIGDPWSRAPLFCGDGWGWAGRPIEGTALQGSSSTWWLAFCQQTLDALCLALAMPEPRPQHPLRPADPKYVAPRTGPLRPPLPSSLFSQPRPPLQQGPCCVVQRPRFQDLWCWGRCPHPLFQPLGYNPPSPPPHTRRNPSTANISEAPE